MMKVIKMEKKLYSVVCILMFAFCAMAQAQSPPDNFDQIITHNGENYTLQMQKVSLRGPNFEVLVQNSSGGYDPYTPDEVSTYMGEVVELPDAHVAGVILDNGDFKGHIYHDRGAQWYFLNNAVTGENGFLAGHNVPNWTLNSVTPGHAGSDTYRFDVGFDYAHEVLVDNCGGDISYAMDMIELSMSLIKTIYLKNALLEASTARVIIRGSADHCPYSGLTTNGLGELRTEWETNQTDADRDVVAGVCHLGGGVAWVGTIANSYAYSQNGNGSDGAFHGVWKHELGHNWGCGDYHAGSPEGQTVMCGNKRGMFSGAEVAAILAERDQHIGGALDNLGVFSAAALPPYAALDPLILSQGQLVTIDVLANDFDANADAVYLLSVSAISQNGGRCWISVGTGPGGRDEVQYMPAGVLGFDMFDYEIVDSTGKTQTGWVFTTTEEFESDFYEAEDATLVGPIVASSHGGYSGWGYADYQSSSGDYVEWNVNVAQADDYDLSFRYALDGTGNRPLEIRVNGQVLEPSLDFPGTESWSNYQYTASMLAALNAGDNSVRATAIGSSGANVDLLKVAYTFETSGPQDPYFYADPLVMDDAVVNFPRGGTLADLANDPDVNETLTFSKLSGPSWLSVASDGTLSGTPASSDEGLNSFSVRVTDSTARTDDTTLEITVVPQGTVNINYQPAGSPTVTGYLEDNGDVYGSRGTYTYGWNADHTDQVRDRGINSDQLLDTLSHIEAGGVWEMGLPNGDYEVKVSIGDPGFSSVHTINVEGVNYWESISLSANQFENKTLTVTVSDGKLTIDSGSSPEKSTRINYVEVSPVGGPDITPPTPDPATWAVAPAADSDTAISMTATTGTDATGPVEYYFDETSGNPGGTDSGWQTSPSYTDTGLSPSTEYTYTVTMRDSVTPTPNVGTPSSPANATTQDPPDTDPPTPNPAT
ncbi:MAG: Ig-like domain-containing protein, partial [Planctomycetota bacterium]